MNADSSRSHSVFIITTEQTDSTAGVKKSGHMYLVDLAGSEAVGKTNATGSVLQVRREGRGSGVEHWLLGFRL